MMTVANTKFVYDAQLKFFLRRESVKYQYRIRLKEDGYFLYEVKISPEADENKVKAAMEKYQEWITQYEHRKGDDGWIDSDS